MSPTTPLDRLITAHPEWAPWLKVARVAVAELGQSVWNTAPAHLTKSNGSAPMLQAAVLRPDALAVARLYDGLLQTAQQQGLAAVAGDVCPPPPTAASEALAVLHAAVNSDGKALARHASLRGATPEGFAALAQLLSLPCLHACAQHWASQAPSPWCQGYCPVCGSWPAFAELRGIERSRHLRCGRCSASWPAPELACTYCGTSDHRTLGSLVEDSALRRFSVETCKVCSGYLKAVNTLQATPCAEVLATDLESVAFDLVALERGFQRPGEPGVRLNTSIDVPYAGAAALSGACP